MLDRPNQTVLSSMDGRDAGRQVTANVVKDGGER